MIVVKNTTPRFKTTIRSKTLPNPASPRSLHIWLI
jgi:hypothetical protein